MRERERERERGQTVRKTDRQSGRKKQRQPILITEETFESEIEYARFERVI